MVAKVLMQQIVCRFGVPLSILTDQGREVNGWTVDARVVSIVGCSEVAYNTL